MEEKISLEERMAKVEGILEEVRARLNHLETEVDQLLREMHTQFRWIVGIILGILIPMWVTIILAIIFIH